jgi:hypothetical protein
VATGFGGWLLWGKLKCCYIENHPEKPNNYLEKFTENFKKFTENYKKFGEKFGENFFK